MARLFIQILATLIKDCGRSYWAVEERKSKLMENRLEFLGDERTEPKVNTNSMVIVYYYVWSFARIFHLVL